MGLIKEFQSPFDMIDTVYIIFALSGVIFFNRTKDNNGKYYYYPETDHRYYIPIIFISQITSGLALQYWFVPELTYHNPYETGLYELIHFHLSGSSIYTVIMLYQRADLFLEACKTLTKVDKVIRMRKLNTSFALIRKLCYLPFIIPVFFVGFSFLIMENDAILSKFWIALISEHHCFVVPLGIHGYSLFVFAFFGHMIHQRLEGFNHYIKNLKNEQNLQIIEQELIIFSRVHSDLCKVWENIIRVFGWPVTSLHLLTYTLLMCLALRTLNVAFQTLGFEMFAYPIWMLSIISWSILVGELIQKEAAKTGAVLCELLAVNNYFGSNVKTVAKTFHLQLLHRNFHIILCGFFNLSLAHFGEALTSITNFIMFIIQMKG